MADNVNHPEHYTQGGIECIDALKATVKQPKTNADRIRQMTDEELVIAVGTNCNRCARSENCELRGDPVNYGICVKGNLAWLKQEASEDAET